MTLRRNSPHAASSPNICDWDRPERAASPPARGGDGACSRRRGHRRLSQQLSTVYEDSKRAIQHCIVREKAAYVAYERLLFVFLSRKSRPLPPLADPTSRWRNSWRWLGVLLLLVHCATQSATEWARYRCSEASGPLLHVSDCFHGPEDYGFHRARRRVGQPRRPR